ncbi:ubinuclein-1-like isoform X4 [Hibiscus syriacus]|uniref:ubinuclein-1-like isoform X4 n=1 Tax=Hibiscus syriacus TaxID=106335 RepID=UPI001920FA2C|nr:ubinuclein-1-like isoform X4 [Hibiscus syriacus]
MAEVRGDKVDDLVLSKHVKVEQGRLNCAATNAVLEEQSSALLQISVANIGTKSEHSSYTEVSNKDASITPSNSKDSDKYRSISIHSSDLGNNTNSLATYQKHLEKRFCKKHKSPVRKLMTENNEEGISTEVEKRKKRATCGELPDLNLPVYPVQSERNLKEMILMELSAKQENADRFQQIKLEVTEMIKLQVSKLGDVATGSRQEVLGSEEKVVLKQKHCMDNIMEDKICDLYDLYIQGMDEDKGPQIRKLYVELAELWPNGIMDKHGIKSAICRAKERKRALCENDKVREIRRKKSAQKMEGSVEGEACSVSELQAVQENQESASSSHILALPCRTTSCKETLDQHLAAPREITSVQPNSGLDISEEKIEKMATPSLKEQMKQKEKSKNREKKLSTKQEKESRKSNKKVIGQPDAAS